MPSASVVIPTYNRAASLRRTLEGLALHEPVEGGFEVVVVSDGSTDDTDRVLDQTAYRFELVALNQENAGPAAARNRGVAAASGRVVVFIDDDTVPDRHLLNAHLRHHGGEEDAVVVMGPMLTPPDHVMTPWVAWEQAKLEAHYAALGSGRLVATARQFYTGNASVNRRRLLDSGGFDVSFRRAEDVELAYRLADRGASFVFDPEAIVLHYAERTLPAWLDVARSYGHYDTVISREKGRGWLLDAIASEFHDRHALVQLATRATVTHPALAAATATVLTSGARIAALIGLDRLSRSALSGAYNVTYYAGMAAELGGGKALIERFDRGR